jgi:hypothetical protein
MDDLIKMKRAAGHPQDRKDFKALVTIKKMQRAGKK